MARAIPNNSIDESDNDDDDDDESSMMMIIIILVRILITIRGMKRIELN